jgi:hypothetical protein
VQKGHLESFLPAPNNNAENSNSTILSVGTGLGLPNSPSQPQPPKDPFDMRKYHFLKILYDHNLALKSVYKDHCIFEIFCTEPFASSCPKLLTADQQRQLLSREEWFHGTISRTQAEALVRNVGFGYDVQIKIE